MCRLSIIVPVYNVEKYLRECLDSICGQNIEDMQVICVEDCSTDSSPEILKEYEKKYPYIEVLKHSVNSGLSAARNTGMKRALGEYIMFVDSDDYIAGGNVLNKVLETAFNGNLDYVCFYPQPFPKTASFLEEKPRKMCECVYTESAGIDLFVKFITDANLFDTAWSAIYKREYLEENSFRFISGILYEDAPFTFEVLLNARRAACVSEILYYYRQRDDSIVHASARQETLNSLTVAYADMIRTWLRYIHKNDCGESDIFYIEQYLYSKIRRIRALYNKCIEEDGEVFNKTIEKYIDVSHLFDSDNVNMYFTDEDMQRIKNKKEVFIYGAGLIGIRVIELLKDCDVKVKNVLVSSMKNNPETFFGVKVKEYAESEIGDTDNPEYVIVAISAMNQAEVVERLKKNKGIVVIKTIAI